MLNHFFETFMDTIWNSISVPCKWEFVFYFVLGVVILEQVVDLVDYTNAAPVSVQSIPFGYEVAY